MDLTQIGILIVGIIGAAAWIPQLIKLFKKPTLTITPANICEVGFNNLGPIFNFKSAITVDNQSVLIDRIGFELQHESGAKYSFLWHEIMEVKGQMIIPGTPAQPVIQETTAIAIKILPTDFKDVFLRNRMQEHSEGAKRFLDSLDIERRRLINNNQYDPEKHYASKTVQDLQAFLQSQMIWKKGKYLIKTNVHVQNTSLAKISVPKMSFTLTEDDIVLLQNNCDGIPKILRNVCHADISDGYVPEKVEWYFLNKSIEILL
jgi:hypothetical protein